MPNMQDRKANRFSRYDAMSTEDLQAFLREDASKQMGEESDTEEILYVMDVFCIFQVFKSVQADIQGTDSLLNSFFIGSAYSHYLSCCFHLNSYFPVNAFELVKWPSWDFYYDNRRKPNE